MPTNPPPCYRCGMRPSMLPIAYCAECYQLTRKANPQTQSAKGPRLGPFLLPLTH